MRAVLDRHVVGIVLAGALISTAALMPGCGGSDAPEKKEVATCLSPKEGRTPRRIHQWKYDVIRDAITEVISSSKVSPVPVDSLDEAVADQLTLQGQAHEEIGTIKWFTMVVLGDMEVRGEVERVVENDAEFVKLK